MKLVTKSGYPKPATLGVTVLGVTVLVVAGFSMHITGAMVVHAVPLLAAFLAKFFVKPDWSYLPTLLMLTLETFLIAFVASVFAAVLSFIVALFAARNCTPHPIVGSTVRAVASVVRAVPDLLLALLLASTLGLGDVPGVIALTVATAAYLVKAYSEVLEVVDGKAIEGVRSTGAAPVAIRMVGIVPQARADLIGLTFYAMDSNLRSAAILGAVGAGGIGYDLAAAIRHFRFDRLGMMILSIYLAVWAVDALSSWVRSRVE
jgi:phosphonate transport system permease protein